MFARRPAENVKAAAAAEEVEEQVPDLNQDWSRAPI